MTLVSIIIPCYNAIDKIGRCLNSLKSINFPRDRFEVIFVDDCSNDGTDNYLINECSKRENWFFFQLDENSGSPSKPRNKGIDEAQGEYVYFLDCDDEILSDAISELYDFAANADSCLIRSELLVEDGKERKLMNQLPEWHVGLSLKERIELIVSKQSTVVSSFIKKSLLTENNVRWPESLRMGEDTVFLAEVISVAERVDYLNKPTFVYYRLPSLTPASTQRYGKRELLDHINVWSTTQALLERKGINYIRSRLHVGIKVSLESLIFKNRGDVDYDAFLSFHNFVNKYKEMFFDLSLSKRLKDLLASIEEGDYQRYQELSKPRLLIAGHDLKFIEDALPDLEKHFTIRKDEWRGHAIHDEQKSLNHLEWAEYIWCEWLLGNAEWYSQHKRPDQRLVVRMHRMELARDHGSRMDMEKVDAVVVVSTYFFERLLEKYPNVPREKVRLIHNYVRVGGYDATWHDDRLFNLAIIGILPSRKGFKKSLEILKKLKKSDERFLLKVFGKRPEDLAWVAKNHSEMQYFSECKDYIEMNDLTDSVEFVGHVDVKTELARQRIGYVLSVSDPDLDFPGPESFHLAIADGFAGGAISMIKHWPGCEYVWPGKYIFSNEDEIVNEIVRLKSNGEALREDCKRGKDFILENYDISDFVRKSKDLFLEIS